MKITKFFHNQIVIILRASFVASYLRGDSRPSEHVLLLARLAGRSWLLALALFFAATLLWLGRFPLVGQDEPWIAAPAAKLAREGVYGDGLFAGYYAMEQHTYNFPPLFPLTEALAFRLAGVGLRQARLVAVLYGAVTVALTYLLGRMLAGDAVGTLATWLLVGLRLAAEREASGVPLLDLARIARYDIAVPPLVLAALACFVWAERAEARAWPRYLLAGALAGLATLAHLYGGFVLAVIGLALLWRAGRRLPVEPAPWLIAAGYALALLPWALYIARDPAGYAGQMLPEHARFRLWDARFYLASLLAEPERYRRFVRGEDGLLLWPRLGIWLAAAGLPLASGLLLRRALRGDTPARLLLLALPAQALLLALLVNLKFYNYLAPLLPFAALQLAWLGAWLWRAAARLRPVLGQTARLTLAVALALALAEGAAGVAQSLRSAARASDYDAYSARVAAALRPGALVLALHPLWFGLYPRGYAYRSVVLATYLAQPEFFPAGAQPASAVLAQIAPDYVLVDRALAPELRLDRPADTLAEPLWRSFREYLDQRCAGPGEHIEDRDYGDLVILRCAG